MSKRKQEFLIYSFLGWVLENCYHKFMTGSFIKPNFLYGPIKPMYGLGGVLLVESHRYYPKQFLYASAIIPLLIEWCSGKWLDRRYHLRYWDYSNEVLHLGGYICLRFALCWVILAQIVVYLIQPLVNGWIRLTGSFSWWKVLFCGFLLDCAVTICRHEKLSHKRRS